MSIFIFNKGVLRLFITTDQAAEYFKKKVPLISEPSDFLYLEGGSSGSIWFIADVNKPGSYVILKDLSLIPKEYIYLQELLCDNLLLGNT